MSREVIRNVPNPLGQYSTDSSRNGSPLAENVTTESLTNLKKTSIATNNDLQTGYTQKVFEFDISSANFGVVLDNKTGLTATRSRTVLGNVRIADITTGSFAEQDGRLHIGDRVLEINSHDLGKASIERAR